MLKKIIKNNSKNRSIEGRVFYFSVMFSNFWMTLISPVIIGAFISKYFATGELSKFTLGETVLFSLSAFLHLVFTSVLLSSSTRKSVTQEVEKLIKQNKIFRKIVIPKASQMYQNLKFQQTVSYISTLELENLIDEINDSNNTDCTSARVSADLGKILSPLVKYRAELFGYSSTALYNFALYLYNESTAQLELKWRSHDDRLVTTGRSWKPGFGHVGLTYILDEIKICHDITRSTELSVSSSTIGDEHKYKSFLSMPIKDSAKLSSGSKPLGVLVFTSNESNQFSLERDKMLGLTIAKLLSIYLDKRFGARS